ncbi:hypothetical protein [Helicobacter pylori]
MALSVQAFKHSSNAIIVFIKIYLKIPYFLLSTPFLTNTTFLENLIQ